MCEWILTCFTNRLNLIPVPTDDGEPWKLIDWPCITSRRDEKWKFINNNWFAISWFKVRATSMWFSYQFFKSICPNSNFRPYLQNFRFICQSLQIFYIGEPISELRSTASRRFRIRSSRATNEWREEIFIQFIRCLTFDIFSFFVQRAWSKTRSSKTKISLLSQITGREKLCKDWNNKNKMIATCWMGILLAVVEMKGNIFSLLHI